MATFNGANIFGYGRPKVRTTFNPRDRQVNSYPALNGIESLDGGSRGAVSFVEGLLFGEDADGLNAALALFESYWNGQLYTFVDAFGNAWPNVLLHRFETTSPVLGPAQYGWFLQFYQAEFHHMSLP